MSYLLVDDLQVPQYIFGKGGGFEVSKALNVPLLGQIPIKSPKEGFLHIQGDKFQLFVEIAKKMI